MKIVILAMLVAASLCIIDAAKLSMKDNKEIRDYLILAMNLPNEDKDTSDPFLVVRNGAGNEIYKSGTSENTLNPVFSPLLEINYLAGDIYEFEVRDEDSLNPDDTLGKVTITVDNIIGSHDLSSGAKIVISQA